MPGLMYHSPADVMSRLLPALGVAGDSDADPAQAWPAYAGKEPPTPDNVVTCRDTDPVDDGVIQISGEPQGAHGVQVRVRGVNDPVTYRKANEIAVALQGVLNRAVVMEGKTYTVYSVEHRGVLYAGNAGKLSVFTLNALVSVRQTAG